MTQSGVTWGGEMMMVQWRGGVLQSVYLYSALPQAGFKAIHKNTKSRVKNWKLSRREEEKTRLKRKMGRGGVRLIQNTPQKAEVAAGWVQLNSTVRIGLQLCLFIFGSMYSFVVLNCS